MLRTVLATILALVLSGCWVSEKDLFGPDDWSPPDGIAGTYTSQNGSGDSQARVVLTVRPDGLVEGVATKIGEDKSETSLVGFVPIAGGSGRYYILVDRTKDGGKGSEGQIYFIARTTSDGFEAFWPQCSGTPDITGMKREKQEPIPEEVCGFSTKAALLKASLAAEHDLEGKHMFAPEVMGKMKREDDVQPTEEPAGEASGQAE